MPYFLALRAEALYIADRIPEALEAIEEAEALADRYEQHNWCAELHRLRGVFLTALDAEENQIEASFCAAIRIAKEQKSVFARETGGSELRRIPRSKRKALET